MDETWLQLMCCAYPDVLSLYFGWTGGWEFRRTRGLGCKMIIHNMGYNTCVCVDMWFQTEELEYMIQGFILRDENRSEHGPGVRGQGSGMRTNYREMRTKNINRDEWIVRGDEDSEVCEGVGCYDRATYSLLWCSKVQVITKVRVQRSYVYEVNVWTYTIICLMRCLVPQPLCWCMGSYVCSGPDTFSP